MSDRDERVFVSLLGLAVVLNGIFGNVFPVASAAHSEKYDLSVPETLRHVQPAKILGLGLPLLTMMLSAPHLWLFVVALAANLVSLMIVPMGFKKRVKD